MYNHSLIKQMKMKRTEFNEWKNTNSTCNECRNSKGKIYT